MKQKPIYQFLRFLNEFGKELKSIRICAFSAILLLLSYFLLFQKDDLNVFPGNRITTTFYTDKNDQGNSILTKVNSRDSIIEMEFILKKGYVTPYAGLNIINKSGIIMDISAYNRIEIELSSQNVNDIIIYLITKDKNVKDTANRLAQRHISENLEIGLTKKNFILNFQNFETPDWWYTAIGQPKSDFSTPDWKQLHGLAFATGLNPKPELQSRISVYKIRFYRDNTLILVYHILAQLLVFTSAIFIFYLKTHIKTKTSVPVSISYNAVGLEEKTRSGYNFLDFINQNYINSELSLEDVSKQSGVPQRNISDTISDKFGCNFKTYINKIRVNEAKRLLKETNLNISEIAYKVGFSSPGSFNRVFKNITGTTPTEYIQNTD